MLDATPGALDRLVRDLVAEIPAGRATTYGIIAEAVASCRGRGYSARSVGGVLARAAISLPWWRVVRVTGDIDESLAARAHEQWRAEGLPTRTTPGGTLRIDLHACLWDAPTESDIVRLLTSRPAEGDDATTPTAGADTAASDEGVPHA